MKTNSFYLFTFLLFFGCAKPEEPECVEKCMTFQGNIFDKNRNIPIENAAITFINCDGFVCWPVILGETVTDKSGKFSFEISGKHLLTPARGLFLQIVRDSYLHNSIDHNSGEKYTKFYFPEIDPMNFDNPLDTQIVLYPRAELEIFGNIKDEDITKFYYKISFPLNSNRPNLSENSSFRNIHDVAGSQYSVVNYSFFKNEIRHQKIDSIYIESGEKGELELNFD